MSEWPQGLSTRLLWNENTPSALDVGVKSLSHYLGENNWHASASGFFLFIFLRWTSFWFRSVKGIKGLRQSHIEAPRPPLDIRYSSFCLIIQRESEISGVTRETHL